MGLISLDLVTMTDPERRSGKKEKEEESSDGHPWREVKIPVDLGGSWLREITRDELDERIPEPEAGRETIMRNIRGIAESIQATAEYDPILTTMTEKNEEADRPPTVFLLKSNHSSTEMTLDDESEGERSVIRVEENSEIHDEDDFGEEVEKQQQQHRNDEEDMEGIEKELGRIRVLPSVEEVNLGVRIEFHEWKVDEGTKKHRPKFASGTQELQYFLPHKIAEAIEKKKSLRMTWDMDPEQTMEIPSSGIAAVYLDVTCRGKGCYTYGILAESYYFSREGLPYGCDPDDNNDDHGEREKPGGRSLPRRKRKNQRAAMAEADSNSKRSNSVYWKREEETEDYENEDPPPSQSNAVGLEDEGFLIWNSLKRTGVSLKVVAEAAIDEEGREREDKVLPKKIVPTFDLFAPEIYSDIEVCIRKIYESTARYE